MKLYIDTSAREVIKIKIGKKVYVAESKANKSQKLLALINEKLRENGLDVEDIGEIEVNLGPGSFTGLRVGVSVAQALGWSLGILVNGKDVSLEKLVIRY